MPNKPEAELILPDLTLEQEAAVAGRHLARLAENPPELLPPALFYPILRLLPASTVEVSFVRPSQTDENNPRILLTKRPPDDALWPDKWHIPGSVVRSGDEIAHEHDWDDAIDRTRREAGGNVEIVGEPKVYDVVRRPTLRGPETTVRFLAETTGEPENGQFFDAAGILRKPPETGLVDSHDVAIARVTELYPAFKNGQLAGLW
jgi:hypothetical protein